MECPCIQRFLLSLDGKGCFECTAGWELLRGAQGVTSSGFNLQSGSPVWEPELYQNLFLEPLQTMLAAKPHPSAPRFAGQQAHRSTRGYIAL